jgi:hypothetical protein
MDELDSAGPGYRQMANFCEHGSINKSGCGLTS